MDDAARLRTLSFQHPFRRYQRQVLDRTGSAGADRRYHIVAPPGAGKTILGLELVHRIGDPAVVFAPTTTIQEQWAAKLRMFLPHGSPMEPGLVSLDPARLATINVFTYQLIAAPSEAGALLGEAARVAWREELMDAGRAASDDEADARLALLEKNNPAAFARELRNRVLRLKRRLLRHQGEDVAPYLHPNACRLVSHLVGRGVRTVVLDECHHLLDYWALVLRHLLDRLDEPSVVGLTATLPDTHDPVAFENYDSLLGPVDFEVPTPALVKEGELAPYRELAYFVHPTQREEEYLREVQAEFDAALAVITSESRFTDWVATAVLGSAPKGETAAWEQALNDDAPFACAACRYLQQVGRGPAALMLPPEAVLAEGEELRIDEWLELLDRYGIDVLEPSASSEDHERLATLRRALHPFGITLTQAGMRQTRSVGDLVLSFSEAKDEAVCEILRAESAAMASDLRAVVVTDFEQDRRGVGAAAPLDRDAGSARRLYQRLVGDPANMALNPVLVTGQTVWLPAAGGEQLALEIGRLLSSPSAGSLQLRDTENPLVKEVAGGWTSREYVPAITALFERGGTRCLVGTRGLLGEGWDSVSLNTLVDVTTTAGGTAVQQLRGRSLRLDPARNKLAHNWDVVCVDTNVDRGDVDLRRFGRRHNLLWGLDRSGAVVRGVSHVDQVLAFEVWRYGFKGANYEACNRRMLAAVETRDDDRARWRIGDPYSNFAYQTTRLDAPDLRIRTVYHVQDSLLRLVRQFLPAMAACLVYLLMDAVSYGGPVAARFDRPLILGLYLLVAVLGTVLWGCWRAVGIVRVLLLGQPPDAILLDMARAVVNALRECGLVSHELTIDAVHVVVHEDGTYDVSVDAGGSDAATFSVAYRDLFAPISNQRFLILRTDLRLPRIWLMPVWLALLPLARRATRYPSAYYPVPRVLGGRRERAETFAHQWARCVGGGRLIDARRPAGFSEISRARARRRPKVDTMAYECWR